MDESEQTALKYASAIAGKDNGVFIVYDSKVDKFFPSEFEDCQNPLYYDNTFRHEIDFKAQKIPIIVIL